MSVGPSELVVILIVVLLLFGSRRLADLGKGIGEGIRGFRRGIAGEADNGKAGDAKVSNDAPRQSEQPQQPAVGRLETTPQDEVTAAKAAAEPAAPPPVTAEPPSAANNGERGGYAVAVSSESVRQQEKP
jgi:sec-independent protein translocase protein TatA